MCRAKQCQQIHKKHFCKICEDTDSDHKSAFCPKRKMLQKRIQQDKRKQLVGKQIMRCKVSDCLESHKKHFCKVCKKDDVSHRSKNCQENIKIDPFKRCRAPGCFQQHLTHKCRICSDQNSDHLSKNCPKGKKLYHGTTEECSDKIESSKLQPSKAGRLGPGIYMTPEFEAAKSIAKNRQQQKGNRAVVITVMVGTGNGYRQQIHPTWKGVTKEPFVQVVIKDDSKLRIDGYQYV